MERLGLVRVSVLYAYTHTVSAFCFFFSVCAYSLQGAHTRTHTHTYTHVHALHVQYRYITHTQYVYSKIYIAYAYTSHIHYVYSKIYITYAYTSHIHYVYSKIYIAYTSHIRKYTGKALRNWRSLFSHLENDKKGRGGERERGGGRGGARERARYIRKQHPSKVTTTGCLIKSLYQSREEEEEDSFTARFRRHDLPESGIRIRFPFPEPRVSQPLYQEIKRKEIPVIFWYRIKTVKRVVD